MHKYPTEICAPFPGGQTGKITQEGGIYAEEIKKGIKKYMGSRFSAVTGWHNRCGKKKNFSGWKKGRSIRKEK
jgi:hypothetical protein